MENIKKIAKKGDFFEKLSKSKLAEKVAKMQKDEILVKTAKGSKRKYKADFLKSFGKEESSNTTKRNQIRTKVLNICVKIQSNINTQNFNEAETKIKELNNFFNLALESQEENSFPMFTAKDNKPNEIKALKTGYEALQLFRS